jgi:hypothetical protein
MARFKNLAATGTIDLTNSENGSYMKLVAVVVGTGVASAIATITDGDAGGVSIIDASAKGYYEFKGALCHKGIKLVLSGGNANVTLVFE